MTEERLLEILAENAKEIKKEGIFDYNIVNFVNGTDDWKYIRENKNALWDFMDEGYKHAGLKQGFLGCNSPNKLWENPNLIRIAFCKNTWVAISVYSPYQGGNKCVGITATTDENYRKTGVAAVNEIIKNDVQLYDKFYWCECSGDIEALYEKYKGIKIPSEFSKEIIRNILSFNPDGFHYVRMIGEEKQEKIVYGFNTPETFNRIYERYKNYIDDCVNELKSQQINEENGEIPSWGRYAYYRVCENVIVLFIDIIEQNGVHELPKESLAHLQFATDSLEDQLKRISGITGEERNRLEHNVKNGRYMLATISPLELHEL